MSQKIRFIETTVEIAKQYDKASRCYDLISQTWEVAGVRKIRSDFLQIARGRVLDVAAGTGQNFRFFPPGCQITAIDLSPGMLLTARKNYDYKIDFQIMNVEDMAFPSDNFDTVVSSLGLCTYQEPVRALREMSRVCKNDGRILLLEHGRSNVRCIAKMQDKYAELWNKLVKCHLNRDPLALTESAGLKIINAERKFFGIVFCIEALPG